MAVFTSKYPDIPEPQTGLAQTLFETEVQNKNVDRVCYVDALTGEQLTFRQPKVISYRFAAGLQDVCGFQRGDVLAMCAPNRVCLSKQYRILLGIAYLNERSVLYDKKTPLIYV